MPLFVAFRYALLGFSPANCAALRLLINAVERSLSRETSRAPSCAGVTTAICSLDKLFIALAVNLANCPALNWEICVVVN